MSENHKSPTYSEYWQQIRAIAVNAVAREMCETADLCEIVSEIVDQHEYITYTAKAIRVLTHTDNDNAYLDNFGADGLSDCDSVSMVYARLAYSAMQADIQDAIARVTDNDTVDVRRHGDRGVTSTTIGALRQSLREIADQGGDAQFYVV